MQKSTYQVVLEIYAPGKTEKSRKKKMIDQLFSLATNDKMWNNTVLSMFPVKYSETISFINLNLFMEKNDLTSYHYPLFTYAAITG